ncbi:MAG: hypothetical protein AAFO63_12365 [Pseudomonadota bacterium]
MDIFLSVGSPHTAQQARFIAAIEGVLKQYGMQPRTLGRTDYHQDAPLVGISALMDRCIGTFVVALKRKQIVSGLDRPGSNTETQLAGAHLPTPWIHIETALAYEKAHPILIFQESGVHLEGVLDPANGLNTHIAKAEVDELHSEGFLALFQHWYIAVRQQSLERSISGNRVELLR